MKKQAARLALLLSLLAPFCGCSEEKPLEHGMDAGLDASASCLGQSAPITLDTGSGLLHGTLQVPSLCPPFPVALIHAGSGPTDRNGNSLALPGRNDSLGM